MAEGRQIWLYILVVRQLNLNIHPEYTGGDPDGVLGDQQQNVHLADHLQDNNSQADFLDVVLLRCLGFRYIFITKWRLPPMKRIPKRMLAILWGLMGTQFFLLFMMKKKYKKNLVLLFS